MFQALDVVKVRHDGRIGKIVIWTEGLAKPNLVKFGDIAATYVRFADFELELVTRPDDGALRL